VPKISKVVKRAQAAGIISGLTKHFGGRDSQVLGGKKFTSRELVGIFQSHIDAIDDVDHTRAAASAAVARERAVAARVRDLTQRLKILVGLEFGLSPEHWADFGWEIPKLPGPKTAAAKVEGARKSRETRAARHTKGKRQKKKIRGW
jgi:hypothetical protein